MSGRDPGMNVPDSGGLVKVLDRIINDSATEGGRAAKFGERNHYMFLGFGGLAIVLGGLAGAGGAFGWPGVVIAFFGFLAAAFAGLQTFFNAEEKARFHWTRAADFKAVAREGEILASDSNITRADVETLSERLKEIDGRQFGGGDRPTSKV
jgi:hypothetical protein